MKKLFRLLITSLLVVSMFFLLSCGEWFFNRGYKDISTEWDGEFLYYYVESEDCYAIVGSTKTLGEEYKGKVKDVVYIPTHYKGKPIRYTCYSLKNSLIIDWDGSGDSVGMSANANKIYLSYLVNPYLFSNHRYKYFYNGGNNKGIYIVNTNYDYFLSVYLYASKQYYTKHLYDVIIKNKIENGEEFQEDNSYSFTRYLGSEYERKVIAANTAYMFNYEDSPNEDYFFINNFERGGKIENTPYEPIRNGYTFTGWYKDEGCTEKWNFETDTLPKWEYDEDGNEIYVETKLYAGWSKNN